MYGLFVVAIVTGFFSVLGKNKRAWRHIPSLKRLISFFYESYESEAKISYKKKENRFSLKLSTGCPRKKHCFSNKKSWHIFSWTAYTWTMLISHFRNVNRAISHVCCCQRLLSHKTQVFHHLVPLLLDTFNCVCYHFTSPDPG